MSEEAPSLLSRKRKSETIREGAMKQDRLPLKLGTGELGLWATH